MQQRPYMFAWASGLDFDLKAFTLGASPVGLPLPPGAAHLDIEGVVLGASCHVDAGIEAELARQQIAKA